MRKLAALVVCTMWLGACGGDDDTASADEPTGTATAAGTVAASPTAGNVFEVSIEGHYKVASDGRTLFIKCWGTGTPTIILETGSPSDGGTVDFMDGRGIQIRALAERTRVCAYDRASTGASDPAPNEPRDADDLVGELNQLLTAARVEPPLLLVGASFGGMIVTYYASLYPDDVAGVVTLDVPAPSAELAGAEFAWDHPENTERLEILAGFEHRFANDPTPFDAPLLVITARDGASDAEDQGYWLELSPNARQVVVGGGHDVLRENPAGVSSEILQFFESAQRP